MKAYAGHRHKAPCILDLGNRWILVDSFTQQVLYCQAKGSQYWFNRLSGAQNLPKSGDKEVTALAHNQLLY